MSTRVERYEAQLKRMKRLLESAAWTASGLAQLMGCTKPTVYARLAALRRRGLPIQCDLRRYGSRGPCAKTYSL